MSISLVEDRTDGPKHAKVKPNRLLPLMKKICASIGMTVVQHDKPMMISMFGQ